MRSNDEDKRYNSQANYSEPSFYVLFFLQFLIVAANMFVDMKTGVCTLLLVVVMTPIILARCNSQNFEMSRARNGMMYLFIAVGIYYLLEMGNPNHVQEAWNISISHYWIYPLLLSILIPVAIRDRKGIEWLLLIWSFFILAITLKGYWQRSHGFNERELYFLYALGGYRTHIIWSGIRYFSLFSDAASYGVHSAMSFTVLVLAILYVRKRWMKIWFSLIAIGTIYSIGISGTRSTIAIPLGGLLTYALLSKSWKNLTISIVTAIAAFSFFYFTNIGDSNQYIRKMRSAFRPTQDASYLVRVENRKKMKELMDEHPFGYGVGLSKGERFSPKELMPYPPDSWLVSVWVETGIVGLVIYLLVHGVLFAWCAWILLFKIMNKSLRGLLAAWLCMNAGFFVSAYVNDVMQYPNSIVVYTGFALCFAGPYIDKAIQEEQKGEQKNSQEKKKETPPIWI